MPFLRESGESSPSPSDPDSVAVIGLACRFPGDALNAERFWDLLCKGRSAFSKVPEDRFNVDAYHHPTKGRNSNSITKGGHFLSQDVAAFDANFFNISHTEAQAIDPQQRFMLEVSYEAFENAGIPMDKLAGTQTGCYVGAFTSDWREMQLKDLDTAPLYTVTGAGIELLANRISWFYDLKGPSMTLETACSASMVSLHQACQSIRAGESKMALVGGANLFLNPDIFALLSNQQFLSPDGLCKSFDASGDGYGRGEGFAALVLKPVDDAIRDGDPIRAVIRGTGTNQDGKTKGITLPSADAQAELIRSTYRSAGLDFRDTHYFEAHGTGTRAGDPAELGAIGRTLGTVREPGNNILVGSVKTNIGHLESVAGLAGLIKGIYILENALIPASLHFKNPNPAIKFDEWRVAIPTQLTPWPHEGRRRVSVNSFGYGGANAHAILDDAFHYLAERGHHGNHHTVAQSPVRLLRAPRSAADLHMPTINITDALKFNGTEQRKNPRLFVFSAQDQDGLDRLRADYGKYLRQRASSVTAHQFDSNAYLRDLAFTLSEKRSRFPWKSYWTASSINELALNLENKQTDSLAFRSTREARVGFVFTGQGAQWAQMGIELCRYETFRESIRAADQYLAGLGCPWSAMEELNLGAAESKIDRPYYSQTICTVLQVALVDLLETWSILPSAVVGHSSGEIAAAYCLGALSKEDAWKVAYYRGLLSSQIQSLSPSMKGAMLAVGLSEDQVQGWISQVTRGDTVVACVNSPSSVTVSGDETGIDELEAMLKQEGIFARKLKVDIAYHSHHMNIVAAPYLEALRDVETRTPRPGRHMYSSVTGDIVDAIELGPANWVRNLVSAVLFSDAVSSLILPQEGTSGISTEANVDIMVEIGPHSALQGPVNQILKSHGIKGVDYRSMLSRGKNGVDTALACAGALFAQGVPVDVRRVNNDAENAFTVPPKPLVDLPTYSWNHSRKFWSESRITKQTRQRKYGRISLLGAPYPSFGEGELQWRGFLRISEEPWIRDHKIQTSILYPAAGFIAMVIEAASQMADTSRVVRDYRLTDIQISTAVVLTEDSDVECILQIRTHEIATRDSSGTWLEFKVSTCADGKDLQRNCSGLLLIEYQLADDSGMGAERKLEDQACKEKFLAVERSCPSSKDPTEFYKDLDALGLVYGPTFQNVKDIRTGKGQSRVVVDVVDTGSAPVSWRPDRPHVIHPTTLDAIFHAAFAALGGDQGQMKEAMVPNFIEEVIISADIAFQTGSQFKGFSFAKKHGFREVLADIQMLDDSLNAPVVRIKGFCCAEVSSGMGGDSDEQSEAAAKKICSKLVWKPAIELISAEQTRELVERANSDERTTELSNKIERLEKLAYVFIRRALNEVSLEKIPLVHLRSFYKWLQQQQDLENSSTSPREIIGAGEETAEVLEEQIAAESAEGEALCKIGRVLGQILVGKVDPVQLLSQNELLAQCFESMVGMSQSKTKLDQYIDLMVHTRPDLSILELGTGSPMLSSALGDLEGATQTFDYTFAGTSASTLEKAKEKSQPWKSGTEFKVLDIGRDLYAQEFQGSTFDIIIGSHSLRDNQGIEKALANTRQLLKPDGKLCLVEVTSPGVALSAILGSLPSWWRKRDDQSSGAIGVEAWKGLLKRSGFSLDFISADFEDPRHRQISLMVATAESPSEVTAQGDEVTILEACGASEPSQDLAARLVVELERRSVPAVRAAWSADLSSLKGKRCIALMELDQPFLASLTEEEFAAMKQLILQTSSLLWVTALNEPTGDLVSGLARSVRSEVAGVQFRTIHVRNESLDTIGRLAPLLVDVASSSTADDEFVHEDGILKICRAVEDVHLSEEVTNLLGGGKVDRMPLEDAIGPQKLCIRNPGILDTLSFEADDMAATELNDDEVEIEVKASGLNFRDVMVAMGQIPDNLLGFEASGVITRVGKEVTKFKTGDHVCTLGHGAHRSVFRNRAIMCQLIPAGISFEEAACLPLVHCTAFYALVRTARVQKGQSILIHAAAGGVGQAAIQLAQHFEMEIYATVGSADKKALIQEAYGIQDDHIFNSRDLSFAKGIMRMTNGRGVDCVLNSLSGEALRQTWHCVAPFGTFVEIGIKDILSNTGLDMRPFLRDTTFAFLNLEHVGRMRPQVMADIIEGTFEYLSRGITKPVSPLTVYPVSEVENAFRLMQTGKHRGKIAVTFSGKDVVPVLHNPGNVLRLDENATYVLVGGLGGLGRSLSNLLVDRGARHLCFISRSGAKSEDAKSLINDLEKRNVHTRVFCCDIADEKALAETMSQCSLELPRIGGAIQCAMVLRDTLFENMTYQQWTESLRPKVQGSWNLHKALPTNLDFFIILSSFSGIFGNQGQSNYAAAGTYEDALAHYRRSQGLKAVTIDLGIMRDVGVLAEQGAKDYLKEWEEPFGIREFEFHALMKKVIAGQLAPDGNGVPPQVVSGIATGGAAARAGIRPPYYFDDVRFSIMSRTGGGKQGDASTADGTVPLRDQLAQVDSLANASKLVTEAVVAKVAKSLQTSTAEIDTGRPLHSYGVDSLVAVEIQNWIFKEIKSKVTMFDILLAVPITTLAHKIASESKLLPKGLAVKV